MCIIRKTPNPSEWQLIILGALPPPRGGVTTHIQRLIPYLEEEGIRFTVWDHSKINKSKDHLIVLRREPLKAIFSLLKPGLKVLHCPLSAINLGKTLFLLTLRMFGVRITVTLVASPDQTTVGRSRNYSYLYWLGRISNHLIATNSQIKEALINLGIPPERISVSSAFIPEKNESSDEQIIPLDAEHFLSARRPIVITYGHGP